MILPVDVSIVEDFRSVVLCLLSRRSSKMTILVFIPFEPCDLVY